MVSDSAAHRGDGVGAGSVGVCVRGGSVVVCSWRGTAVSAARREDVTATLSGDDLRRHLRDMHHFDVDHLRMAPDEGLVIEHHHHHEDGLSIEPHAHAGLSGPAEALSPAIGGIVECLYADVADGGCALRATADSPPPTAVQMRESVLRIRALEAALTVVTLTDSLDQARGIAHAALNREEYHGEATDA